MQFPTTKLNSRLTQIYIFFYGTVTGKNFLPQNHFKCNWKNHGIVGAEVDLQRSLSPTQKERCLAPPLEHCWSMDQIITNRSKTEYKPKCLQADRKALTQSHKARSQPLFNFKFKTYCLPMIFLSRWCPSTCLNRLSVGKNFYLKNT